MEHLCSRRYSSAVRPKMLFPSKRPITREYVLEFRTHSEGFREAKQVGTVDLIHLKHLAHCCLHQKLMPFYMGKLCVRT